MIIFWLVCAIFVAIALAFVLPPLLQSPGADRKKHESGRKQANIAVYRDQIGELSKDLENGIVSAEQYQQDRDELEQRLLAEVAPSEDREVKKTRATDTARGTVYAIAFGLPIIATVLYLRIGDPNVISASPVTPSPPAVAASAQGDGQISQQRIEANIAALAKRLEQNPADTEGWIMLGQSYTSLERYSDASAAYAKATALKTDDAGLWADYAFAVAMSGGKQLQGKPTELIAKALQLDPENPKALQLAGGAAFQAKNYKQAIEYWQRLLQRTPADSEVGQALSRRIAEAKNLSTASVK